MKELKKAQMGIIAVLALMLVSIKRRLPTRRFSSGITTLALAGIVLLVAAGGASANGVCEYTENGGGYYVGGDTVIYSCTFNASMTCPAGHGLIIGADGITIDGAGHAIIGDRSACPGCGEANPQAAYTGILNYDASLGRGHDDVVIKDLEIKNFCNGIVIKGVGQESWDTPTDNNTIFGCSVHDNGDDAVGKVTHGIHLWRATNTTVKGCAVYNNTGFYTSSCGTGGHGIRLFGNSDYCNITCNNIYNNTYSGIFTKYKCVNCTIAYNKVTDNGVAGKMFTGGIRLMCMASNDWLVEMNNVTDSTGPGIFVRGDDCLVRYNTVTGSVNATGDGGCRGNGIFIHSDASGTEIYNNTFCDNEFKDIHNVGGAVGDSNTCDKSNLAGACDWSCGVDNAYLKSAYFDFDGDGYYSDDPADCACTIAGGAKCACCNPGLFNETHRDILNSTSPTIVWRTAGDDINDCDLSITSAVDWYCDGDGDTYISSAVSGSGAPGDMPAGCQLAQGNDCNDGNAAVNPGATEDCTNGIDDDCDGLTDCDDPYCKPDLDITVKKEEWINDTHYNVNYTVCNIGICDAGESNTSIYIDETRIVVEDPVGTLTQNDCYTNTVGPFLWTAPSDNVTVCADNGGQVDEKDETNNCEINTLSARGVNIYVAPASLNITPQDQFDINIMVNPNSIPIYGVEYYLTYNTSVLRAESQVKGPFLGTTGETIVVVNDIDRGAGIVSYAETRKDSASGVNVTGISSVIQFTAIGAATDCTALDLYGVIIVNTDGGLVLATLADGEVHLTNNQAPEAAGCTKHLHNNAQKKFECLAHLCSNSTDIDGDDIVYIRWSFGDGEYGTSEGLGDCPCKYHSYTSWIWEPFGDPTGGYVPFNASLTVTDNGDPQLEDTTYIDVNVYLAGDANYDGTVNILDAVLIGLTWDDVCAGADCCELLWTGNEKADKADLNNDCKINILDAVIVGTMWDHNAYYPV